MKRILVVCFVGISVVLCAGADVVINEISYNPVDENFSSGTFREFVELYNPGPGPVDLSGYQFTRGITFTFPDETRLLSDSYLVVIKDRTSRFWRSKAFTILGPYEGTLADGGEWLELVRPDGTIADTLRYNDRAPWSRTADGYGSTLERIAWDLPSNDFHSWRASQFTDGTPGEINSVVGANPRPVITAHEVNPPSPSSTDTVSVRLGFDAADVIDSVTLQWEAVTQGNSGGGDNVPGMYVVGNDVFKYWKGTEAPSEGDEWTQPEFDDSSWPSGNGMHGYGSSQMLSTQLSDMKANYSSVYLRRSFTIPDAETMKNANLYVFFSGGFICHLNGVEVARANVPQSATHETLATEAHNLEMYEFYLIDNSDGLLVNGSNTISIVGYTNRLNLRQFGVGVYLLEGDRTSGAQESGVKQILMERVAGLADSVTFEAQIPPAASQTLIRFNANVTLNDGSSMILPYVTALRPFESYFVYDGEIPSRLPILWPYYGRETQLTELSRNVSGAVILPVSAEHPLVFDGALVYPSRNGHKLKFLKGEEYRNDRTLNILPERPQGGTTSGSSTPHREELGFWFFREFGIPSPRTDWFRVVIDGRHTQQLLIQQVNERFLEMNGMNPDADLFKRNYVSPNWEPHTNLETGTESIDDLSRIIKQRDQDALHEIATTHLVIEEFLAYSVASVLSSNWDGFHNNHWMYLDPDSLKWEIIPWDLDKAWGFTDSNPMFAEMPIEFPLNGQARHAARSTGPITGWLHKDEIFHQQYIDRLALEFNKAFSLERMYTKIAEREAFLRDDLQLIIEFTGLENATRREQITESYDILRTFVQLRREYLSDKLPTPVSNWSLY